MIICVISKFNTLLQISVDESTSFENKKFLSKDQKTITNEVIERDLDSIRNDINNIIKDGEEKIGGLIGEIDEIIPKKKYWYNLCGRGYVHDSSYRNHINTSKH